MNNSDIDEWATAILKPDGAFDPPENLTEEYLNRVRADILAEEDEDIRDIRFDEMRAAAARIVYGGHDPKFVPNDVMKFVLRNPTVVDGGFINMDARNRVKNPNTGIRAKCLECQGNDQVGVRQCPSFNCPLWPFRQGGNPFYARLIGSSGEEESNETDAEIEALEPEYEDENV